MRHQEPVLIRQRPERLVRDAETAARASLPQVLLLNPENSQQLAGVEEMNTPGYSLFAGLPRWFPSSLLEPFLCLPVPRGACPPGGICPTIRVSPTFPCGPQFHHCLLSSAVGKATTRPARDREILQCDFPLSVLCPGLPCPRLWPQRTAPHTDRHPGPGAGGERETPRRRADPHASLQLSPEAHIHPRLFSLLVLPGP